MVSRANVLKNFQNKFRAITKPEDYVEVILQGWSLDAIDRDSAKRSKDFYKNRKIKEHVFAKCHKDLDLLVKLDDVDRSVSPMSERDKVVFKFSKAEIILDQEKSLLLDHISNNGGVKKITTDRLKLPATTPVSTIKKILDSGDIFKQGSTYEKIFNALKDNRVRSTGYLWFGIRPVPIPVYHLSKKSINLIKDIS